MTGREPARFSIHTALNNNWTANAAQGQADYLPPETVTITRLLHQAGYRVGHFGKWYVRVVALVNVPSGPHTEYSLSLPQLLYFCTYD